MKARLWLMVVVFFNTLATCVSALVLVILSIAWWRDPIMRSGIGCALLFVTGHAFGYGSINLFHLWKGR
jgi:hypothetical protein